MIWGRRRRRNRGRPAGATRPWSWSGSWDRSRNAPLPPSSACGATRVRNRHRRRGRGTGVRKRHPAARSSPSCCRRRTVRPGFCRPPPYVRQVFSPAPERIAPSLPLGIPGEPAPRLVSAEMRHQVVESAGHPRVRSLETSVPLPLPIAISAPVPVPASAAAAISVAVAAAVPGTPAVRPVPVPVRCRAVMCRCVPSVLLPDRLEIPVELIGTRLCVTDCRGDGMRDWSKSGPVK